MDILNSSSKKKNILIIFDDSDASEVLNQLGKLKEILSSQYSMVSSTFKALDFSSLDIQFKHKSAIIISAKVAALDDFSFLRTLNNDCLHSAIPVLVFCNSDSDYLIGCNCLQYGATDIIMPPFHSELLFHRIENAIRLKDSATFYEIERMLKELPSNIYLKDAEGRYIFATHYWHHLEHPDDPDWSIRGKTDVDIRKDRENAIKAMEADREILKTGIGTSYTIEINADGIQEFMEIIKQPVRNEQGEISGIIGLINNVTDKELLRIELEKRAMLDKLTGVYNRIYFEQYISDIKSKNEYPICIISADCNGLKAINDTYGHIVGDEYLRMSTLLFRMFVPENGSIFRIGGDEFVLILPEKSLSDGEEIIRKMKAEQKNFSFKNKHLSIALGAACLNNENDSLLEVIDKSDKLMYLDKAESKKEFSS